ncbi:MAG TPA: ABC transporter permease, partial [Vicinamibacterales bacterium]|nr:ABC transporter permease [Vicinamibacterales bacterium]
MRRRLRSGLVVIEIALAFILLTGAGLLIRSFVSLQRVDPGFDATNVLTMGLPMPERLFVNGERANRHIERVLTRLAAVPGVREAAFTSMLPLQGWGYAMPCIIAGRPAGDPNAGGVCFHKMVTPSYFSALRMRIERGRGLAPNDIKAAPPALVVNRTFVNSYLSGTDPIGQRVKIKEIVPAGASSARKSRGRSSGSCGRGGQSVGSGGEPRRVRVDCTESQPAINPIAVSVRPCPRTMPSSRPVDAPSA